VSENLRLNGMMELHWLHRRNAAYEAEILRRVDFANCVNTWDSSVVRSINPALRCYRLEYNLRDEFYNSVKWRLADAERHVIVTNPGGTPLKGLHMLIRALAMVRRDYPDARLVVPGMGDAQHRLAVRSGYAKYIRDLMRRLELADAIEFCGRLDAGQMADRMRRSHVVVVPSAIEGTSLVLREAMFLGVPCVASFRGGMGDFVRDKVDGFLYDYQEYPYLAQRICELFASDALCEEFSRNAQSNAEAAHDRTKNVQAYLQMYQGIVALQEERSGDYPHVR
jgi:glycosyltransferase involved in cell wall biosynthesis